MRGCAKHTDHELSNDHHRLPRHRPDGHGLRAPRANGLIVRAWNRSAAKAQAPAANHAAGVTAWAVQWAERIHLLLATTEHYQDSEMHRQPTTALMAVSLGDRRWHDLLDSHHTLVRRELTHYRGREIDTAGDSFFATFDGPARAVRCACTISEGVRALGLEIRAGLHTGECELIGDKPGGIAVHTGARVAAQAGSGEVLVSSTVRDLVADSGLSFQDRGVQVLKGIPGEWRLFAVEH